MLRLRRIFLTSDGIALTFDQRQSQQENSSQGSQQPENEQPGTSTVGERVGNDFLKDEYDFSRFTHDFYEYEQGQKNILVKDRLKKHLSFWRDIGSNEFVLDVIQNGYKIPLYSMPDRTFCKNNRSALLEPEFVSEAIKQQRVVVNGVKSDWAPVLSGVPQGTVLGPLLFSLYINDISSDIESEIRLFADDCVCYREIKDEKDTMKLQRDIDRLGSWARKWGMRFQPVKCNMMQLTRKRIKKIHASYTLEGTNLENVESIKYLGVTITSDLRWNTHVSNVCTKANRTLGFLRRNLHSCPQEVKEAAYKGLVRPVLDYGSSVWDPPGVVLQEELESVQKRAARFVTGNYSYETGSMTGILGQLKWESLKKRRKDNRLILLYKGLKGKASVPTDDLIPKTRRCRNQHSMAFQTPIANTDVYKGSFFPQTIRDWNALPDSLISSAEDAEDCVAKFTSLVRARD